MTTIVKVVKVLKITDDTEEIVKAIREFLNEHALEIMEARKNATTLAEIEEEQISITQCYAPKASTIGAVITTITIEQIF